MDPDDTQQTNQLNPNPAPDTGAQVEAHLEALPAPDLASSDTDDTPAPPPKKKPGPSTQKSEPSAKSDPSDQLTISATDQPDDPGSGAQEPKPAAFTPIEDDQINSTAPKPLRDALRRAQARVKELENTSPESHASYVSLREEHAKTQAELTKLRDAQAELAPPPFDPNADADLKQLRERHISALAEHRKDLGKDGRKLEAEMNQQVWPLVAQTDFSDSKSVAQLEDRLDQLGYEDPAAVRRYLKDYATRNQEVTALQQEKEKGWLGTVGERYKAQRDTLHQEIEGAFSQVSEQDIASNPLKADHILAHHVRNNAALQNRLKEIATEYEAQHLGLEPVTDPATLTEAERQERFTRTQQIMETRKSLHVSRAKGQLALEILPALQKELNRLKARAGEKARETNIPTKDASDQVPAPPKKSGDQPYRVSLTNPEDLEKESLNPHAGN